MSEIYYASKDYPKAITTYQKAAEAFPEIKKKGFYSNIGLAYAKNNQFKEAYNAFAEYEKLFPDKGQTYRNWAVYYAWHRLREYSDEAVDRSGSSSPTVGESSLDDVLDGRTP